MIFWRRRLCCLPWGKRTLKCFLVQTLIVGFASLFLLICMLLMYNNNGWKAEKMTSRGNSASSITQGIQSRKSQVNSSLWALWNRIRMRMPGSGRVSRLNITPSGQLDRRTYPYNYIINEPEKCRENAPFLILLVAVGPGQAHARQAIRKTWGDENLWPGIKIIRLFLLGRDAKPNGDIERYIMDESQQHHDIIQHDYMDTYYNLTIKTLMGMNWVATYCPHVSYVMKTDSDMFVNTEYLINKLLKPDLPPRTNYFTGYFMRGYAPNRNKNSKWYMPPDLYTEDMYPVFCSGTGYVFSGDMAEKIFKVSLSIRRLHLEDVYVGICLAKLHIDPMPPPNDTDFNHWRVSYSDCKYSQIITSHEFQPNELIKFWNQLQKNKHNCRQNKPK
ncbi:beta-1,3-galactosyltransferase 2 isoform 1-T3 [Discoglossus pictus]